MTSFFGKYRGKVEQNADPENQARLLVSCPAVMGTAKNWAMPSVPYAGKNVGFFAMPPVGANVWVEFEAGNIDYPIWSGCFWGKGDLPARAATPMTKFWETEYTSLVLDDRQRKGGITLSVGSPAVSVPIRISAADDGVTISLASVKLQLRKNGIDISLPPGSIGMTSNGVVLKHGGAAVALQRVKVSINNGAFEVT